MEYMDSHWHSVELTTFSLAIVGDATCQGVQVEGEGRVYSGESVRVTNEDVTGWRAVNLPYFGRVSRRERVASLTQGVGV